MKTLKLVGIGCGHRTFTYLSLAIERFGDRFELVGVADPIPERTELLSRYASPDGLRVFDSADALLAEEKFADIALIGTQDDFHVEPCIAAMKKGYDILLEKPISNQLDEVLSLEKEAEKLGRRVMVCHVLRYAPLYQKVKELVDSGLIGEIQTIHAVEGISPWHFCNSYIRGHWAVKEKSSPIMLAKSCHDMDIISWILGLKCQKLSSFGALSFFKEKNAPEGSPARCTDGCPVADTCDYNALHYMGRDRGWLKDVFDAEFIKTEQGEKATDEEILQWLETGPWGRCVFHCDNNVPDHQTVNMLFDNEVTGTFILSAFDSGRSIEIHGTKGILRGGSALNDSTHDISVSNKSTWDTEYFDIVIPEGGYGGHGGGDAALVSQFYKEMTCPLSEMLTSLSQSIQSHVMAFAAEESRLTLQTIDLEDFANRFRKE